MRPGGALLAGGLLLLQAGGGLSTGKAVERINAASMRPLPDAGPRVPVRGDLVWVPDRWVPVPGAPEGVRVPGHWERRLSEREYYVPTQATVGPPGVPSFVPAGVRGPADARREP